MPSDSTLLDPTPSSAFALPAPPVVIDNLALFLDMDGVLAPFADSPDAVLATPRRTAVLQRLDQVLNGRMAIVSGRTLDEIDRISGEAAQSASGVHGLERRRADGSTDTREPSGAVRVAVQTFKDFAAHHPGVIVEDKGVSAGLHYRQAPTIQDKAEALAQAVADQTGLKLQPGSMVLELKTPGTDKGTALTAFMDEQPFAGSVPVMLGDDLTDEHAFVAARSLGGFGVLVGLQRDTAARYRLDGVDAVLDWLEAVAGERE